MIYFVYQCSKGYEKEEGKGEKREEKEDKKQRKVRYLSGSLL